MKSTKQVHMRYLLGTILLLGIWADSLANPVTGQLQEVLDSGADLVLEKGKVYEIDATLIMKTRGQRIYTPAIQRASETMLP